MTPSKDFQPKKPSPQPIKHSIPPGKHKPNFFYSFSLFKFFCKGTNNSKIALPGLCQA